MSKWSAQNNERNIDIPNKLLEDAAHLLLDVDKLRDSNPSEDSFCPRRLHNTFGHLRYGHISGYPPLSHERTMTALFDLWLKLQDFKDTYPELMEEYDFGYLESEAMRVMREARYAERLLPFVSFIESDAFKVDLPDSDQQ